MTAPAGPLARLETAHRMLAEASSVDEVKLIRDQAEVARLYARERDLGLEAQNYAAEIKLRAERKLGAILAEVVEPGRPRKPSDDATVSPRATLADLGLTPDEWSRFQEVASVPEEVFERHVADMKAECREPTTASVARLAADTRMAPDEPAPRMKGSNRTIWVVDGVLFAVGLLVLLGALTGAAFLIIRLAASA